MKKLLICLLMMALMFSIVLTASAVNSEDAAVPEIPGHINVVPSIDDLPDGYVVDDEFEIKIQLNAENGWYTNITELFKSLEDDEYVYYVVEENIAQGYAAEYTVLSTDYTNGKIIVITNVNEDEPPIYELPQTGGNATSLHIIIGCAIIIAAAMCGIYLHHKQTIEQNP